MDVRRLHDVKVGVNGLWLNVNVILFVMVTSGTCS